MPHSNHFLKHILLTQEKGMPILDHHTKTTTEMAKSSELLEHYTVPLQNGKLIPLETHIRDSLSILDVVWANKFEHQKINPQTANEREAEFFRGAPPQWLNFYWAEQEKSHFAKRDIYKVIESEIKEKKNGSWSFYNIDLHHQPCSGGSTLAMQVMWNWRKQLRCARVIESTTDIKTVAKQVLTLFNAGGPENQNTVLLLLDNMWTGEDKSLRDRFENSLFKEMKADKVKATVPVVIILNCFREKWLREKKPVKLWSSLSENEKSEFKKKHDEIIQKYEETHTQFYAFNIMQNNYKPFTIIDNPILKTLKKKKRSRKQQLLAFLALLNSYVPGSYISEDLCKQFLNKKVNLEWLSLEEKMQPFTEFLVTFSKDEVETGSANKHVRIVHPKVAEDCLNLLTDAGVSRSETTRQLITELCRNTTPPYLLKAIKHLLTKRETMDKMMENGSFTQKKGIFSKLIEDIEKQENSSMCVSVLRMASKKLANDPFLPQALARFFSLVMTNYKEAQYWAKTAIIRDEGNSFIRDTLGQVHKHHLKRLKEDKARETLQIGKRATDAFQDVTKAALREREPELRGHGLMSTSTLFNNRGLFGYMQVANIIFDHLTTSNKEWSRVLTKEISTQTFVLSERCGKYTDLLNSLKDEVESKFEFFERYLTYSKPSIFNVEPSYFRVETKSCYINYITQTGRNKTTCQVLKEKMVSTFAGLLTHTISEDSEWITQQLEGIFLKSMNEAEAVQNYIIANIMLSQTNSTSAILKPVKDLQSMLKRLWEEEKENRSPEFYLLVLLLFWPDGEQFVENSPDMTECIKYMHDSFAGAYENYLRSRFLVPLFFLKKGNGLQRLIRTTQIDQKHTDLLMKDEIIETTEIQDLQRVQGEVKDNKVLALRGSRQIQVSPHNLASVQRRGLVSFYLGFNIKGPVAYSITYEQKKNNCKISPGNFNLCQ